MGIIVFLPSEGFKGVFGIHRPFPAEPHNPSLVRKHYAALRAEMDDVFGKLFEKLSKINEKK